MLRTYKLYLEDVVGSITKIINYIGDYSLDELIQDDKTLDAVIRNFEIIGIAVKKIPDDVKVKYSFVEWARIVDFRNILAHEYFGINYQIMWDIIKNKLPALQDQIKIIINAESP